MTDSQTSRRQMLESRDRDAVGAHSPRREVLVGAGLALGAASVLLPSPAHAGPTSHAPGLPVVKPGADISAALAVTPRIQLEPGATYRLAAPVLVPTGALVVGNGATVTTTGDHAAFVIRSARDVTVLGVRFVGSEVDPVNSAHVPEHVAVRIERSHDVRVQDCDFLHWRGAGVVATGASADDYFAYRTKITGNSFSRCFMGVSAADRSEYGIIADNHFVYCRLAVWNSSGNWQLTGNDVVGCYGALYTFNASSPYGALTSDNWAHGAVTGNTFNHSNGGAKTLWNRNAGFAIGGVVQDPGAGIVVSGVLPPTFSGNTLWYTNIRAVNLAGTRWLVSGTTLSNLTVTCEGAVPVILVGTQSNAGAAQPRLVGNVRDALAPLLA